MNNSFSWKITKKSCGISNFFVMVHKFNALFPLKHKNTNSTTQNKNIPKTMKHKKQREKKKQMKRKK